MSDQWGQDGGRPDFAPPGFQGPVMRTAYVAPAPEPSAPQPPVEQEPVRFRLTGRTGVAIGAGLVAILLVSGAVTVWASSTGPKAAMPAAWTAEPSAAETLPLHPTAPVASGNRAATPTASSTASASARTSTSATKATATQATTYRTTMTAGLPACGGGGTVSTTAYTAKVPQGWTCLEGGRSASDPVLTLYNVDMDMIDITVTASKDAVAACGADIVSQVSTLEPQPDTMWGGKPAKTAKIAVTNLTGQVRCVESKGVVYMMVGAPMGGTLENVVAGMSAVSTGWVWK